MSEDGENIFKQNGFELKCSKCGSNNTDLQYGVTSRIGNGIRGADIYATIMIALICIDCKFEALISEKESLIGRMS